MRIAAAVIAIAGSAAVASAQFSSPNLPGNTDFDGWDNLTRSNPQIANANPPFPGFIEAANPWPEAIESVLTQGTADPSDDDLTGDAAFDKLSGFGYPAGVSIYASPFGNGTFSVADATPISDLETVVFQIQIGSGSAGWLESDPTLIINGSTAVPLFDSGTFSSEFDPDGPFGALTINVFAYQWDVSGLGPITDFDVQFTTAGTSTTIFGLQLDQGDQFAAVEVPAPGAVALLGLGALSVGSRRRR